MPDKRNLGTELIFTRSLSGRMQIRFSSEFAFLFPAFYPGRGGCRRLRWCTRISGRACGTAGRSAGLRGMPHRTLRRRARALAVSPWLPGSASRCRVSGSRPCSHDRDQPLPPGAWSAESGRYAAAVLAGEQRVRGPPRRSRTRHAPLPGMTISQPSRRGRMTAGTARFRTGHGAQGRQLLSRPRCGSPVLAGGSARPGRVDLDQAAEGAQQAQRRRPAGEGIEKAPADRRPEVRMVPVRQSLVASPRKFPGRVPGGRTRRCAAARGASCRRAFSAGCRSSSVPRAAGSVRWPGQ